MFVVVSPSDRFKVRVLLTLPTPRLVVVWFFRVIHGDSGDGVGVVPTRRHRRRAIRQLARHRRRPCRRLDSTFGTLRGLPDNGSDHRAGTSNHTISNHAQVRLRVHRIVILPDSRFRNFPARCFEVGRQYLSAHFVLLSDNYQVDKVQNQVDGQNQC